MHPKPVEVEVNPDDELFGFSNSPVAEAPRKPNTYSSAFDEPVFGAANNKGYQSYVEPKFPTVQSVSLEEEGYFPHEVSESNFVQVGSQLARFYQYPQGTCKPSMPAPLETKRDKILQRLNRKLISETGSTLKALIPDRNTQKE